MLTPVTSLCLLLCFVQLTEARPDGAPQSSCASMTPPHGTAQTSASPYTISAGGATEYEGGVDISVTVSGGSFKGILLQARKSDGSSTTPLGTFSDPISTAKTMQCTAADDAVTHSNAESYTMQALTVKWTPPQDTDLGDIVLIATIAEEKETWWKDVKSDALSLKPSETTTASETTTVSSDNSTEEAQQPEVTTASTGNNAATYLFYSWLTLCLAGFCGLAATVHSYIALM